MSATTLERCGICGGTDADADHSHPRFRRPERRTADAGTLKSTVLDEVAASILDGSAGALQAQWLMNIANELRGLKGPRRAFLTDRRSA